MFSKNTFPEWLPITVVILIAVILRLPLLNGSFWLDEAAQALESNRSFSEQLLIRDDFQPPLLHYIVHFTLFFSDAEWWLRTIGALIPGILTIYFTYKIGTALKNKTTGLIAAVLLSTSSFHVFYSQELRQYALPALFAVWSWYLIIKWWKNNGTIPKLGVLSLTLLTAAGLFSSYLYPFLVLSQLIWLFFFQKKHLFSWLLAYAGAGLLFLPWVPSFFDQLQAGTEVRNTLPGWSSVVSPTQLRALPLVALKFIYGVLDVEPSLFFIATALLLIVLSLILLLKIKNYSALWQKLSPIPFWLVIPLFSSWIISFWIPVLQPKRVLYCLPAFYLVLSFVAESWFTELKKNYRSLAKYPGTILVILLLFLNIISLSAYWTQPALQRENWRNLIHQIETKYPKGAVAVFAFNKPFAPWGWYADPAYPALATGELYLSDETALQTIKQASSYNFIMVFDYLRDLTDPERKLDALLIEYGYKEIEVIDYPLIGFVRIYSKPEAVISYR